MCISERVSLGVFSICMVSCYYLFQRNKPNDKWIAILFIYLGSIQLLEYFMWRDQECNGLNQRMTTMGFWHNILQPLISLMIAYHFTNGKIHIGIYIIFVFYMIFSFPKIWNSKKEGQCSKPCSNDTVGLSWQHTKTGNETFVWSLFCVALVAPLLAMKNNGRIYSLLIIGTYIMAHFISVSRCPNNDIPPNGSWWCLLAALLPLLAIKIN